MSKKKEITIDELAGMVARGFSDVGKDISKLQKDVDGIKHTIATEMATKKDIERLEKQIGLRDLLSSVSK